MTPSEALARLEAEADPVKAEEMLAFHKVQRTYLGVQPHKIDAIAREWRQELDLEARIELAKGLWDLGIHETMIAAAKLFEQARIRPDDSAVWDLLQAWVPQIQGAALADQVAVAGQKRLVADPSRIAALGAWVTHENKWTRRVVLGMTLPWAKMNFPKEQDLAVREQALAWAGQLTSDRNWFMQKAIAAWIADLSRHDKARAEAFLAEHAEALKTYARKDAGRHIAK